MWIEATPNGKFKACERYIDPLTGKTKKATTTIEKDTKAQRKAAENVLKAKIEKLISVTDHDSITLKELTDKYLEWQKREIKPTSIVSTEFYMNSIRNILGDDTIVSRLSAGYVSDQIIKKSSTPYMTNRNVLYFKALINWAYDHDYIHDKTWLDKIKRVKAPRPKSQTEDHYLEQDELKKLIEGIDKEWAKLLTEFLALSGLRIGEAMALLESDVDEYIHVTKTYDATRTILSNTPKTDSSRRDVFIQPELAEVVKKIRAYRRRIQMQTGVRNDIFFPYTNGEVISYDRYQKILRKKALECIGRNVSPHMLRHTHTSLLAEKGISLEVISRRLGHRDSDITKEVYLHVTKKQKQKEERLLSNVKIL